MLLPSTRRKNRIGISDELPQWWTVAWNLVLVAVEACLICWAHFAVGVSWVTLGVGFAAVAALGVALVTWTVRVHTPRAIRRHRALLQSYKTASTAHTASTVSCIGAAFRVSRVGTVEVVDRQPTPHHTAPSATSASASSSMSAATPGRASGTSRVSRTR